MFFIILPICRPCPYDNANINNDFACRALKMYLFRSIPCAYGGIHAIASLQCTHYPLGDFFSSPHTHVYTHDNTPSLPVRYLRRLQE